MKDFFFKFLAEIKHGHIKAFLHTRYLIWLYHTCQVCGYWGEGGKSLDFALLSLIKENALSIFLCPWIERLEAYFLCPVCLFVYLLAVCCQR